MLRPLSVTVIVMTLLASMATVFSIADFSTKIFITAVFYVLITALFFHSKVSLSDVGLGKGAFIRGFLVAIPFIITIVVGAVISSLLFPTLFQDSRYQQSLGAMLFMIAVTIPFLTVFIEELAFRGLLIGSLLKSVSSLQANTLSAVAFGLWHFFTAQAVVVSFLSIPNWLVVVAVLLATTTAGLFFGWLRLRSKSVVAPILVHWCINASGVLAAYIAWR